MNMRMMLVVPSAKFAEPRPCVIFCHGFAGFTRWDDVAHDLCRAGIAVVVPHHRGAWGSEGEESHPGYRGITDAQFRNRMLLRDIMVAHGFKPLEEEWWHFTLANEPYPDDYFDFPVCE